MRAIDTYLFWHNADGGPRVATSCVGLHPLPMADAVESVCTTAAVSHPASVNHRTLTFPERTTGVPRDDLHQVLRGYGGCACCHLCSTRTRIAQFRGGLDASIAFFGEGPGKDEDDMGHPFVGRSGKLQDAICRDSGIEPERDVFWMNGCGCRPARYGQKDRPPSVPEMIACSERTWLLLRAIRPRVVVCLGKVATSYFFREPPPVWSWQKLTLPDAPDDWIMVGHAYHPAYLVRVIGAPSMYKEYAASRSFYSILSAQMVELTKVSEWRFPPLYATTLTGTMVSWHQD